MQTHPKLPPLAARPLMAQIAVGHTVANGPLEPENKLEVSRGMRPWFGPGGAVAAGGGYPGPIIRQFTFATRLRPTVPVNVVTGTPTAPGNARLKQRKRGRRWTL